MPGQEDFAALQYLPARQRAVLILRDVLGWHAAEVAELLGISTAAANSILQRARERLEQAAPAEEDLHEPAGAADRTLLDRYAAAFESADVAALTELLRHDATLEMPPQPYWFAGRDRVTQFLVTGGQLARIGRSTTAGCSGRSGCLTSSTAQS